MLRAWTMRRSAVRRSPRCGGLLSIERSTVAAKDPLSKGKTTLVVDFVYDGGGMGKGGQIALRANGTKLAEGRLARSIPIQFSLGEGLDVGMDVGSPIDFTYQLPFAFTGKIEKVTIELKPKQDTPQKNGAA